MTLGFSTHEHNEHPGAADGAVGAKSASDSGHKPVLAQTILQHFNPRPGMVCLDCTVGRAGHASQIAPKLAPGGHYIALDVDPLNAQHARQRLEGLPTRVDVVLANFSQSVSVLQQLGVCRVDLLLADLGFASNQVGDASRGFSFKAEGPLDMRLDPGMPRSAGDLVNQLPEAELADLIYQYGEERRSRIIARKIVEQRRLSPIKTTTELAQLVRRVYTFSNSRRAKQRHRVSHRIDPATRTFMALRIAVNGELDALQQLLDQLPELLRPGAVAGLISFHSLEDRLIKRALMNLHRAQVGQRLTPKPIRAGLDERRANRRSRSAKLRMIRWAGVESSG